MSAKGDNWDVHQTWGQWVYLNCIITPIWFMSVPVFLAWDWLVSKASGGRIPRRW